MASMRPAIPLLLLAWAAMAQSSRCVVEKATTQAIQAAIDACSAKGGGTAYVPPGQYVTGPLWMKSNVELFLEAGATLAFSQNSPDWPSGVPALINAQGARNIALTGRGTIDGKAQYVYADVRGTDGEIREEMEIARKAGVELKRYYRTGVQKYIVVLQDSQEIRIEGIRLINAPLWTVRLQDCDQVWIRGVYIYSDLEKGVNADGIDIVSTSNVSISDSTIITADDAICLKTEAWRPGRSANAVPSPVRPTENITVTNSILSSSSTAMVIGTETYADIRHVVFSNIVVRDSNRVFGLRVKMLPENRPDKRATHAIVVQRVEGLTLRNIDVAWDDQFPEPAWGSALVLRDIDQLTMDGFHGSPGSRAADVPAVQRERVHDPR